jgi:hypothetical protein
MPGSSCRMKFQQVHLISLGVAGTGRKKGGKGYFYNPVTPTKLSTLEAGNRWDHLTHTSRVQRKVARRTSLKEAGIIRTEFWKKLFQKSIPLKT